MVSLQVKQITLTSTQLQQLYKASAAAKTPAAPPTRAIAPVGNAAAGAKPLLRDCGAADPPGVCDAGAPEDTGPEAVTTAKVPMYSPVWISLLGQTVVVVPSSDPGTA
jgi:hypothetical protein